MHRSRGLNDPTFTGSAGIFRSTDYDDIELSWHDLQPLADILADDMPFMVEGEISTPVQSRFGIHVIRLDAKAAGEVLPFEAVRERLLEAAEMAAGRPKLHRFTCRTSRHLRDRPEQGALTRANKFGA